MAVEGATQKNADSYWLRVIARSLAYLSLRAAKLQGKDLADQGSFLQKLGLTRRESAEMLGTSEESLRVLLSRAKRSRRGRRATQKARKIRRKSA